MDRSFLSSPAVIEASRDFVCIRLATYEDAEEAEYLRKFNAGIREELENTVLCFLSPDGSKQLTRATRGTRQLFRDPADLAEFMGGVAMQFPTAPTSDPALPRMKDVRLAVNVAACDGLPLVVSCGSGDSLQTANQNLAQAAFSTDAAGKFIFATTGSSRALQQISDLKGADGIYVLKPDQFGRRATLLSQLSLDSSTAELTESLASVAAKLSKPQKSHQQHVRAGLQAGVEWETEVPVTDPMSIQATERRRSRNRNRSAN